MKTKILIPLAGVALFCACKGAGSGPESADTVGVVQKLEKVNESKTTSKNKTDQALQSTQKMVKTASMHFKVKDVRQTSNQIAALTANCNGTVMYHTINSVAGDSTTICKTDDSLLKITVYNSTADMTVRIPSANVESFVTQVVQMGLVVNSLKFEVSDKTFDYLSTGLKLNNQKERARDKTDGSARLKDPDNLLNFKNNMVDQQIKNLKTDDSVKNAVIALNFYQNNAVHKELIANPDLSAYTLPLATRLGTSLKNGWAVFIDIMVELANLWVLVPIGGLVWLIMRNFNKRKKVAEALKS